MSMELAAKDITIKELIATIVRIETAQEKRYAYLEKHISELEAQVEQLTIKAKTLEDRAGESQDNFQHLSKMIALCAAWQKSKDLSDARCLIRWRESQKRAELLEEGTPKLTVISIRDRSRAEC